MLRNHRRATIDAAPDRRVTSVLEAAAAPTEPGPLPGEADALAAFRAAQGATRTPTMLSSLSSAKVTLVAALSGLVLTGGIGAAAAAGSLPGAAQDTASELLGRVGVTVPGANGHSADHADERGASTDATDDAEGKAEHTSQGKSAVVTELAKSDLEGREKGAAVSEYASHGKSQAGDEHGKGEHGAEDAKADHTKQEAAEKTEQADAATTKAPVQAPKASGSDAQDDVKSEKDDSAAASTHQNDETSEGHGAAGSESRP